MTIKNCKHQYPNQMIKSNIILIFRLYCTPMYYKSGMKAHWHRAVSKRVSSLNIKIVLK